MQEPVQVVDPISEFSDLVSAWLIVGLRVATRKTIRRVGRARYVHQFEVKHQDSHDPPVLRRGRCDVGIPEHALHRGRVHLNSQPPHADEVEPQRAEGAEQAVQLELWLRKACLAVVECD